jgi:ribonuclease P/MRP protein subunit POP5
MKGKIKPLLPSLSERKRYLAYEVMSKYKFNGAVHVNKVILDAAKEFLGSMGMANAGILALNDKWDKELQRGLLRVNNKHVNNLKASLIFVKNIDGKEAIIKSVGASGILKKTEQNYFN